MLLSAITAGLLVGLAAGGRLENLANHRLRWVGLLFLAVLLRYGTEAALQREVAGVVALRLPLFVAAYGLLLLALWLNRRRTGLSVVLVGALANGTAILANEGWMPVWQPSLAFAGLSEGELATSFHRLLPGAFDATFLLRAGPFADIIPIPFPLIQNVASIGDVFIAAGLFWFLFTTLVGRDEVVEPPEALAGPPLAGATRLGGAVPTGAVPAAAAVATVSSLPRSVAGRVTGSPVRAETGLASLGFAEAATMGRPLVLGGAVAGVSTTPGSAPLSVEVEPFPRLAFPAIPERVRRHPYVRLAFNADFSALWLGQLISLFGDRVHQIALGVLVYQVTGSELGVGLVFVAATLPNLLVGPLAGILVDRWGAKGVMVASDLLRGALVLLLPIAALADIRLVYPIVFGVTAISMFSRPARFAALPRIVARNTLQGANSLSWVGESLADVVGYPLAGVFVAFLAGSLTLAFWFDAATYVVSAVLILTVTIPPLVRAGTEVTAAAERGLRAALRGFRDDLVGGWRFLRGDQALFANTLISMLGQLGIGATLALTVVYARDVLDGRYIGYPANYAALDGAIGLGNLVGGFAIGLLAATTRRGWLVIGGYVAMGVCTMLLALTGSVFAAGALMFGMGIANMVFVIPTQTLFQERTPEALMGRVIGLRFSVVFGSITAAMAVSGLLATAIGVAMVFAIFGGLSIVAGLTGLLVPAVRNA